MAGPDMTQQCSGYPQPLVIEKNGDGSVRVGKKGERCFDLLTAAERCRFKASQCELSAKNTTSAPFAKCYRQLAELLVSTADLEEGFVRRDLAAKQGDLHREPKVSAAERANRLQQYLLP